MLQVSDTAVRLEHSVGEAAAASVILFSMRGCVFIVLLLCSGHNALQAQEPEVTPEPYVLHVYTNLIQVPTLVLNEEMKPVSAVPKSSFEVRIDSGAPFHPTSLRREGNDPISLGILLDMSGDQDSITKAFADSFPKLVPDYLHAQDHVSIFVLDCKLLRSLDDAPTNAESLTKGMEAALRAPHLHGEKKKGACGRSLQLRNSLAQISRILGDEPGRRVLFAVTDGHDGGSSLKWAEVQRYAAAQGVAVFGFRDAFNSETPSQASGLTGGRGGPPIIVGALSDEDLFRAMCESNGGIVFSTTRYQIPGDVKQVMTDLRERYIVEFPRPDEPEPGMHNIEIEVSKRRYLVHSTGVSVSLPSPEETDDPNTVPVSKSPANYGKRKPINP